MKKKITLCSLLVSGILLVGCSGSQFEGVFDFYNKLLPRPKYVHHSNSDLSKQFRGVWVGKDAEIVRTDNFELSFERNKNDSTVIYSTFSIVSLSDSSLTKHRRGFVEASSNNHYRCALKSFRNLKDKVIFKQNNPNLKELSNVKYTISERNDSVLFKCDTLKEIIKDGRLFIYSNGRLKHCLSKIEQINTSSKEISPPKTSEASLSECLKSFILGSSVKTFGKVQSIEINTKKHMYFFMVYKNFIYCRAAHYNTCNKGVLFAQNIRITVRNRKKVFTYMADDNRIAGKKLLIDESMFNPNMCVFTPKERGGWSAGIYWSIKKVNDNYIILNGCGGEDYKWKRSSKKIEWFY